jgi:hypothetical protein
MRGERVHKKSKKKINLKIKKQKKIKQNFSMEKSF